MSDAATDHPAGGPGPNTERAAADHRKVLIETVGLTKRFPVRGGAFSRSSGAITAVDHVDLRIFEGEVLGLVGESGCGKTTLSRLLLRLIEPDEGTIDFDGIDLRHASAAQLRKLRQEIQVVFQDPYSSLDPRATIGDSIGEGLRAHGVPAAERRRRVGESLELVGLDANMAGRYPHEFSGGQRQRIGIARALVLEPRFLIADEPVSALDVSIRSQILNLLRDLQRRLGFTILFVSHDLAVVEHLCDRVAVMYLGRVVESAGRDDLFDQPAHPYTSALLSAVPVPDPSRRDDRRRIILPGDVPSPADPPSGCHFHPRCPEARAELCPDVSPDLLAVVGDHLAACHYAHGRVTDGDRPT